MLIPISLYVRILRSPRNFLRVCLLQVGDMDHSLDIFGCKGDLLAKLSDKEK